MTTMTKKNLMVKEMLINILTVGVFACTLVLTSCSDDFENEGKATDKVPAGADTRLLEAYGLMYTDFETASDVQILNADTTEISVSKKLADKLGITSFVGHPMGIWQAIDQLPYARKTVDEKLVGDTYILKVKAATLAELIGENQAQLSTSVYVNDAPVLKNRAGSTEAENLGAKYVDEAGIIHPAVIHLTDPLGYDEDYHLEGDKPALKRSAASDGHYEYITPEEMLNGSGRRALGASMHVNVLSLKGKISFDHDFHVSAAPGDTLSLSGQIPIDYSVNYFMTLDGGVRWSGFLPELYVKKFETGLDGNYSFSPECYLSWRAKANLKKEMERLTLATFGQYTFTFVVGVVPVCVMVKPSLYMKFNAGVEGGARVGFKYDYASRFKAGIRYQGGWSAIKEFEELKNDFKLVKPEAYFSADAGVGFYLGVDVMIYGVAGPEIGIGPNLGAKLSCASRPFADKTADIFDFKASVDLKIHAFAGAKLSILGYDLAKWSTEVNIAGPWTLFKYPSDGSEHKDPNKQKQEEKNAIWNKVINYLSNGNTAFVQDYENFINKLMDMYNVEREEAISILADHVFNGKDATKIDLNDSRTMAELNLGYTIWKGKLEGEYEDYLLAKCVKETREMIWTNEKFTHYATIIGHEGEWKNAVDFGMVVDEFKKSHNRLPEQTSADLQELLKLTFGSGYYCYQHHKSEWKDCYNYLMSHVDSYNHWTPENCRRRAAYDTMMIWYNRYHKEPARRDNWENMADDFNSTTLDLYSLQREGYDINDPK